MEERLIVLDTCILLNDPSLTKYNDKSVYIPIAVYSELDKQKDREGVVGMRARTVNRNLKKSDQNENYDYFWYGGVKIYKPSLTRELRKQKDLIESKADDAFLNMRNFEHDFELHTHDFSLHQLMRVNGLNSKFIEQFEVDSLNKLYSGFVELIVDDIVIDTAYESGKVNLNRVLDLLYQNNIDVYPNMFFILKSSSDLNKTFLCRYDAKQQAIIKLVYGNKNCYKIQAKDFSQKFAMEALLNPNIKLITMSAPPGSGKTILSLAAGLQQKDNGVYDRVLIAKNTTPLDKWSYQGWTTGSTEEKLLTQFGNYTSTLESIFKNRDKETMTGKNLMIELVENAKSLEILDIASIRGSSFEDKFIIIDEAEDFDINTMRAILTRIGHNTKIIVIGDLNQRTIASIDPDKSGLYAAIEWLKEDVETAHVTLQGCHRSDLVGRITEVFDNKYNKF